MSKKLFISIFILFISLFSFAGDQDTNYVQKFSNIFAIKPSLNFNGFVYTITPRNNDAFTSQQLRDARVLYSPYITPALGISLNIMGIGASYSFRLKNDFGDTVGHATSSFQSFSMNIYKNKFGFEAYYQDYRRFYYHYLGDQNLFHNYNSDIRAYQWGANGIVLFNGKRFSYNAAFNQTELQKKTSHSMLLMLSLKYNEIKSDTLIPNAVKHYYVDYQTLERNRNYAILLHLGYAFNLTKKGFYFSTAVLAGVGAQLQTYTFPSANSTAKIAFPLSARAKASMGYNGKVFFSGVFANYDIMQTAIRPMKTQQMIYNYGVYVGLRAVKYSKTKGQLKAEKKQQRLAAKEAKKKEEEEKKKAEEEKRKLEKEQKKAKKKK